MCGIVGYIGDKNAVPILISGLKRLEYRGYDSAGIAVIQGRDESTDIQIFKKQGKVVNLENLIPTVFESKMGIAHTRWATHGVPNDVNAHPHYSASQNLAIVHNGIIENYNTIKATLESRGCKFISDTDTEVLINLIETVQRESNLPLEEAVRLALSQVKGAYAIVVMDKAEPSRLIAARKSSPLLIGIGDEGEFFVGSDASPFLEFTNRVIYLEENQIATIDKEQGVTIKAIKDDEIFVPVIQSLDFQIEEIERGGFEHFMLKEIHQQPNSISDAMRGRMDADGSWVRVAGVEENAEKFKAAKRITIVACGTSWHSALVGEYLIEELCGIPVEVEYASEFRYRNPIIYPDDIVIGISQSGETADTIAALKMAKQKGAFTYGVVNVVGSTIARLSDFGSYIHAGPEIGVASTKAFTGQLTVLTLMAIAIAKIRGSEGQEDHMPILKALNEIPEKIEAILKLSGKIEEIAAEICNERNMLYLGRGYNFPVALEGALKLKEISYIHAEGYPAAEMKHGPIALIDKNMPVVILGTNKKAYEKIVSNVQEVKARGGLIVSIVNEGDKDIVGLSDYSIQIPATLNLLSPLLTVIPLQLLSYYIAVMRGCNVDQPRNLAKSVTVE